MLNGFNGPKVAHAPREFSGVMRNAGTEANAFIHTYLYPVFRKERSTIFDSIRTFTTGIRNRLNPSAPAISNK